MSDRWTLRNIDTATNPTAPRSLALTATKLQARLMATAVGKPVRLEYDGEVHQPRSAWGAGIRAEQLMRQANPPDRIIARTERGPDYAVKLVRHAPAVPDGPGTDPLDQIVAAARAECARRGWPYIDMGICVDKPGEHGFCNAIDARFGGQSVEEIHFRLEAIALWTMEQGKDWHADRARGVPEKDRRGLPVNGTIWLSYYWEEGNTGPRPFSGTAHVFHIHTSAWPSFTGWV